MRMKRFLGSALHWYMMVPFHLKNMMFFPMTRNSFAVWRTLRSANLANETAVRERLDNPRAMGVIGASTVYLVGVLARIVQSWFQ